MKKLIRAIPVRDERGDELTLVEFQRSFLRAFSRSRMVLDSGEAVNQVDDETFIVVLTGEKLSRNKP
ncbi:MAG: hypothetical protein ABI422_05540 [Sphingomicrobium sp.]